MRNLVAWLLKTLAGAAEARPPQSVVADVYRRIRTDIDLRAVMLEPSESRGYVRASASAALRDLLRSKAGVAAASSAQMELTTQIAIVEQVVRLVELDLVSARRRLDAPRRAA